jgi:hypothetical protein
MPLFLSLRAAIRAHVTATAIDRAAHPDEKPQMAGKACRYLDLAARLLRPRPSRLIAIGGLSGSGKSTLAAALASGTGARVLRSDVIRKRLFGVSPETGFQRTPMHRKYRTGLRHASPESGSGSCCGLFGDHRCRLPEA